MIWWEHIGTIELKAIEEQESRDKMGSDLELLSVGLKDLNILNMVDGRVAECCFQLTPSLACATSWRAGLHH